MKIQPCQLHAMVTALDDVVGNMTEQLIDVGMYENTVIIFSSDNGGIRQNHLANFPLKGMIIVASDKFIYQNCC